MRGDEWSRLVSEPTATEVDAALAEVRVRAVPIARCRARGRRAMSLLVAVLATGGAFWAGGLSAASNGVSVGAEERAPNQPGYLGAPEMVVAPGAPSAARFDRRTYRITSWTEWLGVRYGESESWVSGPRGTGFALAFGFFDAGLKMTVHPSVSSDTVRYEIFSERREHFGQSARGLDLYEEGSARGFLRVPRGRKMLLYPNGKGSTDEPRLVALIEGPDIEPPASMRWADSTSGIYGSQRFQSLDNAIGTRFTMARNLGVRIGYVRTGEIRLAPLVTPEDPQVRLRVAGRSESVELFTRTEAYQRVRVPGMEEDLMVLAHWRQRGNPEYCLTIRPARSLRESAIGWGGGCFRGATGWQPFRVELKGVVLQVEGNSSLP